MGIVPSIVMGTLPAPLFCRTSVSPVARPVTMTSMLKLTGPSGVASLVSCPASSGGPDSVAVPVSVLASPGGPESTAESALESAPVSGGEVSCGTVVSPPLSPGGRVLSAPPSAPGPAPSLTPVSVPPPSLLAPLEPELPPQAATHRANTTAPTPTKLRLMAPL